MNNYVKYSASLSARKQVSVALLYLIRKDPGRQELYFSPQSCLCMVCKC